MIAAFGFYWLINYLNYQGVSQTQYETLGFPYGSSNFQDKRWFGSVPHRNITFELQIFHSQCYYGYPRILILIFLIVLRFFQSRDHTSLSTTATESDWLNSQPKKELSWTYWMGFVLRGGRGKGGGGCRYHLQGTGQFRQKAKVAAGTKGKICKF